ncbi:hypothetical protein BCR32DRAFT_285037 [Anaeromyces robustus]|uniref:Homeobox domain-containing protein n=1 Tax=Anaeromyces robustus TaxID=1754192 RepID=A0A1Y1WPW5_9FUNG|nr:hypothetical protein BCR32DRAFT_285037 [Anaeromyces robustus]|eukprot:ORX75589.1 hypothetical protein BCR32DRAFT_285037 [Anaeromyces robustus]
MCPVMISRNDPIIRKERNEIQNTPKKRINPFSPEVKSLLKTYFYFSDHVHYPSYLEKSDLARFTGLSMTQNSITLLINR